MCDHVALVKEWGVDTSKPTAPLIPTLWGCTRCSETFFEPPVVEESVSIVEHSSSCDCFGCKARTLKVAYSGIGGGDYTAQKKWDRNLDAYRKARAEGIQPKGTTEAAVRAAVQYSDKIGTAFKAG